MRVLKSKWEDLKTSIGLSPIHYHPVSYVTDITTLLYVISLFEEGLVHPTVDKVFDLEDIMEAHRYVERGHTKGKVVIKVYQGNDQSDQIEI